MQIEDGSIYAGIFKSPALYELIIAYKNFHISIILQIINRKSNIASLRILQTNVP